MRCLVTFVDEGRHKISLSTADLEEVDGDMILNQVPAARFDALVTEVRVSLSLADLEGVDGDMILNQVPAASRLPETRVQECMTDLHPCTWFRIMLRVSQSLRDFGILHFSAQPCSSLRSEWPPQH